MQTFSQRDWVVFVLRHLDLHLVYVLINLSLSIVLFCKTKRRFVYKCNISRSTTPHTDLGVICTSTVPCGRLTKDVAVIFLEKLLKFIEVGFKILFYCVK